MLRSLSIYTILPAEDLQRARAFYRDTFDLEPTVDTPEKLIYDGPSGHAFELYATPNARTAQHTQMGLKTDDLEAAMAELRSRGVVFDEYDDPGFKTENGVATMGTDRACWFHDSEGNTICLSQTMT